MNLSVITGGVFCNVVHGGVTQGAAGCSRVRHLEALHIKGGDAGVTAPDWVRVLRILVYDVHC